MIFNCKGGYVIRRGDYLVVFSLVNLEWLGRDGDLFDEVIARFWVIDFQWWKGNRGVCVSTL